MIIEMAKETLENFKLVSKCFIQAKCLILCSSKNANRAVPDEIYLGKVLTQDILFQLMLLL